MGNSVSLGWEEEGWKGIERTLSPFFYFLYLLSFLLLSIQSVSKASRGIFK